MMRTGRIEAMTRPLTLTAAMLVAATASGQSRQVPAPPQNEPIVIHSATVHTVSGGVLDDGHVVFADGRITGVGRGAAPAVVGARVLDATGLHVYPGLIASHTQLGLTEVGAVDVTQDHTEYGRLTPEVRAAVAVNPDSDLIPVARANGILTALVFPQGGLIAGRCSSMRLDGWTWEQMAIDAEAGVLVNWPRTEPISAWWMNRSEEEQRREIQEDLESVERVFDEARAYLDARAADPTLETDLRFEAMAPALRGEKPLYVQASSMGQIESAVGWAARRGIDIVIVGGNQADRVIPLLKQHDVPVIIDGLHRLPSRRDAAYDEPFTLPLRLHDAGVQFCISSGAGAAHERNLNHVVATAAAYGLPREASLRAVTLGAAELIGLGDSHGAIEVGRSATLIVTSGDPLEITTDVLLAYVDGRRIDLDSRHTELHEKYREKYRQLGLIE
ncbi:MAG: amidohydrolase family protein [Planctomycetota bacterium]|jgi:imidazolonepropionase-like amidohydrolase